MGFSKPASPKSLHSFCASYMSAMESPRRKWMACCHARFPRYTECVIHKESATCIGAAMNKHTTPRGFEPLRAEPNGFRVHLLSRSDTVSVHVDSHQYLRTGNSLASKLFVQLGRKNMQRYSALLAYLVQHAFSGAMRIFRCVDL